MVDAPVAEHLEVLGRVTVLGVGILERVVHGDASIGLLRDPVHHVRLRQPGGLEQCRDDVDHMVELLADLASCLDAVGPVHHHPVPGATEVRRHLLRPLVRSVHCVRPTDRVVVECRRRADLVEPGKDLVDGFFHTVERFGLVERPVETAFGRCAVVTGDVDDDRVVEHADLLERVDEAARVEVGVLGEPGVGLHQPSADGALVVGELVPGDDSGRPVGELGARRNDARSDLGGQGLFAHGVPAPVEAASVLGRSTPSARGAGRGWHRRTCT